MSKDLVCLVADKNIEAALDALLRDRKPALGLSNFSYEIHVHQDRDPGCYHTGPELLGGLLTDTASRGLLVFDQAWQGNPHETAMETERAVKARLEELPADVVVIEPEIEAWIWSPSAHVEEVLGWKEQNPPLREWLQEIGLWDHNSSKPHDPKEAMEQALRQQRIPRSSSLYREIAGKVSLRKCEDASFQRLGHQLREWFPA